MDSSELTGVPKCRHEGAKFLDCSVDEFSDIFHCDDCGSRFRLEYSFPMSLEDESIFPMSIEE